MKLTVQTRLIKACLTEAVVQELKNIKHKSSINYEKVEIEKKSKQNQESD